MPFFKLCIGSFALFVTAFAAQARTVGEQILQPYVDRGEIAGAVVLVTDRSKVLEYSAVGYANVEAKKPMPKDAVFWMASTYKPFVGTAVMMMVEEGKIALDDPVSKYLPGFDPPVGTYNDKFELTGTQPAVRQVTVRMLLSHVGGINPSSPPLREGPPPPTLAEYAASYAKGPLLFEPGSRFVYTNASVDTAARIVEVASGMSFDRFLHTRVFDPLRMKETALCLPPALRARRATAYYLPEGGTALAPAPTENYDYALSDACEEVRAFPALFSTAPDLTRFMQMLLSGGELDGKRYLTQASIDEMTRNQLSEETEKTVPGSGPPDYISYGLGWGVNRAGAYFHPGVAMTDLIVDPTHKVATILLMQSTSNGTFSARAALIEATSARYAPPPG